MKIIKDIFFNLLSFVFITFPVWAFYPLAYIIYIHGYHSLAFSLVILHLVFLVIATVFAFYYCYGGQDE